MVFLKSYFHQLKTLHIMWAGSFCSDCLRPYPWTREAFVGPYCECPQPQTVTTNTTEVQPLPHVNKTPEQPPSPSQLMQAHQYLYYVRCAPVLSDFDYDKFCKRNGLDGGGGSDRASDYPPHIIAIAAQLSSSNAKLKRGE